MQWLHSIEEIDVPEGFLGQVYKKMDGGKRRPFLFPASWKLPIQAVAMVTIVFLVLYFTKMMPVETLRMKGAEEKESLTSTSVPAEKQVDQVLAKKETEKDRVALQRQPEPPRLKETEQAKAPASKATPVLSEPKREERTIAPGGEASLAAKPHQEIVLRISDREKVLVKLRDLVNQFGGEIISTERDVLLASLPPASFSEFKKELTGPASPEKAYQMMRQKDAKERSSVPAEEKRTAFEGKGKEVTAHHAEGEDRLVVRILLLQE
jgi:hypothetical protein